MNFKIKNLSTELISIFVSLSLTLLMFFSFYIFKKEEIESNTNLEKFDALNKITEISNSIETEINSTMLYTDFFSIIISQNPNIDENILETYSSLTLKNNKSIKGIQFAPNAIVKIVYPKEGNEAAINHDLLKDPKRKIHTQKAIDSNFSVLQGPVIAKQGGYLLFSRKAIFYRENNIDKFWGLAVVAMDFDKIIEKYKKSLLDEKYLMSIKINSDEKEDLLFYYSEIFKKDSIQKTIKLPEATWDLAIYPKDGWKNENSVFKDINGFLFIIIIIVFILLYLLIKNIFLKLNLAKRDLLTDTLNKNTLRKIINKRINQKKDNFVFFILDINGFKQINDNLGHFIGDCVLVEIANRLEYLLRSRDLLSRFGGDEYIICLNGLENRAHIENIIKKIQKEISKPIVFEDYSLEINISIGYSKFPSDAQDYNELYKIADKKMYEFKKSNRYKKSKYENLNKKSKEFKWKNFL